MLRQPVTPGQARGREALHFRRDRHAGARQRRDAATDVHSEAGDVGAATKRAGHEGPQSRPNDPAVVGTWSPRVLEWVRETAVWPADRAARAGLRHTALPVKPSGLVV